MLFSFLIKERREVGDSGRMVVKKMKKNSAKKREKTEKQTHTKRLRDVTRNMRGSEHFGICLAILSEAENFAPDNLT